jgi:hypothetical protein
MFTVRTAYTKGGNSVTAKGNGKQRTVKVSPNGPADRDHGAAVGALLNVLLSPEQQAKVRHPSGKQRVRVFTTGEPYAPARWTIEV